jgi:hypothetical protein
VPVRCPRLPREQNELGLGLPHSSSRGCSVRAYDAGSLVSAPHASSILQPSGTAGRAMGWGRHSSLFALELALGVLDEMPFDSIEVGHIGIDGCDPLTLYGAHRREMLVKPTAVGLAGIVK